MKRIEIKVKTNYQITVLYIDEEMLLNLKMTIDKKILNFVTWGMAVLVEIHINSIRI